jgi:uncharacterized protein YbjT (DUF2867 family)
MKILLTGANGYIGMRLLPKLVEAGHTVVACVRSRDRFEIEPSLRDQVVVCEIDFLAEPDFGILPKDIDMAFYLIHSMSTVGEDFEKLEQQAAENFVSLVDQTACRQVIYLSGLSRDAELSKHLRSRLRVEEILKTAKAPYTIFQSGIIVGSGSASFEIIRDLIEKLPVMIAPKWLSTKSQPIAVSNVIQYLLACIGHEACLNKIFEIGGPEVLTYKEMLLQFAQIRRLKRAIFTVPIMTPRLSSYWLYFVTSTSYPLAVNLVNSIKVDIVPEDHQVRDILPQELIPYREAVQRAFLKIRQNEVVSSWKDALVSSSSLGDLRSFVQVPDYGIFTDYKIRKVENSVEQVRQNIFSIGGERGWYYGSFLWRIRGFLDKLVGGVGLRRGRTSPDEVQPGDALDFWRVLVANRESGRLLLYAEMKLPGEAWLEFNMHTRAGETFLEQKATFRPSGILGRLYWWTVFPFHIFVFNGMIRNLERFSG